MIQASVEILFHRARCNAIEGLSTGGLASRTIRCPVACVNLCRTRPALATTFMFVVEVCRSASALLRGRPGRSRLARDLPCAMRMARSSLALRLGEIQQ